MRGGQEEDEQQLGAAETSHARPVQEARATTNADTPVTADEPAGKHLSPYPRQVSLIEASFSTLLLRCFLAEQMLQMAE